MLKQRELSPGVTLHEGKKGAVIITRLKPGHLMTTLFGYNDGELGPPVYAVMDAIIAEHGSIVVYMDTREQKGISSEERERVTDWAKAQGKKYSGHLLFRSKLLELALALGNLVMRGATKGYSDPTAFERVIAAAVPGFRLPSYDVGTSFKHVA